MIGRETINRIHCPINLFFYHAVEINLLTYELDQAFTAAQKSLYLKHLVKNTEILLTCSNYNKLNPNCRSCRRISTVCYNAIRLVDNFESLTAHL